MSDDKPMTPEELDALAEADCGGRPVTGEACPICDRAECQRGAPMDPEHAAALERVLAAGGNATDEDRALVLERSSVRFGRTVECNNARVDWRQRALTAEAALAEARDEIAKLKGDRCDVCDTARTKRAVNSGGAR